MVVLCVLASSLPFLASSPQPANPIQGQRKRKQGPAHLVIVVVGRVGGDGACVGGAKGGQAQLEEGLASLSGWPPSAASFLLPTTQQQTATSFDRRHPSPPRAKPARPHHHLQHTPHERVVYLPGASDHTNHHHNNNTGTGRDCARGQDDGDSPSSPSPGVEAAAAQGQAHPRPRMPWFEGNIYPPRASSTTRPLTSLPRPRPPSPQHSKPPFCFFIRRGREGYNRRGFLQRSNRSS